MVSEINTYGTNNSVCIENTWQEGCLTNPLPVNNNVLFDKLLCSITPHFVFSRTTVVYVLHSVYRNLILLKHSVLLYSCISNLVLCCSNCSGVNLSRVRVSTLLVTIKYGRTSFVAIAPNCLLQLAICLFSL